jgi:hypothetical protein
MSAIEAESINGEENQRYTTKNPVKLLKKETAHKIFS